MTNKLKNKIPTSIEYDPIKAAKYRTRRDYYYHNDPLYRKHVNDQHRSYELQRRVEDPDYYKNQKLISTKSKESAEKQKQYSQKYYTNNKDRILVKKKIKYDTDGIPIKKSKLPFNLELREESD